MSAKVELSAKAIYEKKFGKGIKGYDAVEVDAFLDIVIKDYIAYNHLLAERNKRIEELTQALEKEKNAVNAQELARLKAQNRELQIENASYKSRLQGIQPGTAATSENIDLIKRINFLETFLHNEGYDLHRLKSKKKPTSDPGDR